MSGAHWLVVVSSALAAVPATIQEPASRPATRSESRPGETVFSFEDQKDGETPRGWQVAETRGAGTPAAWRVASVDRAPSGRRIVGVADNRNQGSTYNMLLSETGYPADLRLRVRLRADAGGEDQGGGLVWRVRDANHYYVTRWNPLEDNLRLYKVVAGERTQMQSVATKTDPRAWHEIEVRMNGAEIEVWFNGQRQIVHTDSTLTAGGKVGLWTKADAATSFDDLTIQVAPASRPGK